MHSNWAPFGEGNGIPKKWLKSIKSQKKEL
jgi:hypothetical protein